MYTLLAGLAIALRHGFEMPDGLETAANTYVDVDIHKAENAAKSERLATLPVDCADSADRLEAVRDIFEEKGVMPKRLIDSTLRRLRSYDSAEIAAAKADTDAMLDMVRRHFHCG